MFLDHNGNYTFLEAIDFCVSGNPKHPYAWREKIGNQMIKGARRTYKVTNGGVDIYYKLTVRFQKDHLGGTPPPLPFLTQRLFCRQVSNQHTFLIVFNIV